MTPGFIYNTLEGIGFRWGGAMLKCFLNCTIVLSLLSINFQSIASTSETELCSTIVKSYVTTWNEHKKIALDIQNGVYSWNPELQSSYLKMLFRLGDRLSDLGRELERFQCHLPEEVLTK